MPLLQVLQTLSLQEAAARAALLILASTLSCMLANKLLDAVGRHLEARSADAAREGMAGPGGGLRLVLSTAAAAVHRPGRMLAPIYSLFYSLLVASGALVGWSGPMWLLRGAWPLGRLHAGTRQARRTLPPRTLSPHALTHTTHPPLSSVHRSGGEPAGAARVARPP